jgi:glycosyltransferase involved in cell wall biosynthesis
VGAIDEAIEASGPEVVVTLGTLSQIETMLSSRYRRFVTWIGYFPFEGQRLPSWRQEIVRGMDWAVTQSEHGREEVLRAMPDIRCEIIRPGVDLQVFRPLPQAKQLKRKAGLGNRFVVGSVARNHRRKQLPLLIEAFGQFRRRHRDTVLYLHTDPFDHGWNLVEIIEQHGIARHALLTEGLAAGQGVSDSELNDLYNLLDVMVLPSMGEGFGLPILECLAAGTPVIATGFSAPVELLRGRGELLPVESLVSEEVTHTEMAITSPRHILESLERLYRNPDLRAEYQSTGRAFARQHTWSRCAGKWADLLSEVESARWVSL